MRKSLKAISIVLLTLIILTGTASAQGLLRAGSKGSAVKKLQSDLTTLGYSPGAIDGIFGNKTKKAVISFQKDNGLSADGIVGNKTSTAIEKKLNGKKDTGSVESNRGKPTSTNTSLRTGSRGNDVKKLQSNLKSLGYSVGSIDGIFGKRTKNAVIAFQKDNNLSANGVADSKTLKTLEKALKSEQTVSRGGDQTTDLISKIIATAKSLIDVPYRAAGTTPNGFDCSGFTQYIMAQQGIELPRSSKAQYNIGKSVDRKNLKIGDLVFFNTSGSGISHVGLYIGNNSFISATSSKGVAIVSLSNSYWNPKYVGAKRVIQ